MMPTKSDIKEARELAGLSQSEASELIHCSALEWAAWESGEVQMHLAFWDLFELKVSYGMHLDLPGRGSYEAIIKGAHLMSGSGNFESTESWATLAQVPE